MLKKLLTGCLTIAMIGAFSAGVSAETTFKWSGNAEASLEQLTTKDGAADAVTSMDMSASGDLDFSATKAGDTWTGTAYIDIDVTSSYGSQALGVDDLYVKMSNDSMGISFGEFDPIGKFLGKDYAGELDPTYWGDGTYFTDETGWLMVSLPDTGLDVFLGINVLVESGGDTTADDGSYGVMSYGVTFNKAFGDLSLVVQYVTASTTRNEKSSDAIAEDSTYDGASGALLALGVSYSLGEMAFTFNYSSEAFTAGGDADPETETVMELVFDMAMSDTMGLTFAYDMGTQVDEGADSTTAVTIMLLSLELKTDQVNHYFAYGSSSSLEEDADDPTTETTIGYTMKVGF
jgi:hypothetical protein